MKPFLFLFFLSTLFTTSIKTNVVVSPFEKSRNVYHISGVVDLNGQTVHLPKESLMKFCSRGVIKNGVIVGEKTRIKAGRKQNAIFQNIIIRGSWTIPEVYSCWMDFSNYDNHTNQIRNLFALCSGDVNNVVYIAEGKYMLDGYDYEKNSPAVIEIPSHTSIYNEGIIQILPTSSVQSFPLYFCGVTDCLWEGGTIIGDLEGHVSEMGEQGFGLALRGSSNITIRNVVCKDCWGDGINLQYGGGGRHNQNIRIAGVKCDGNRRQGISVEDGIGITIENSIFCNTGRVRGTAPRFGLDIEPCYESATIQDVIIENCIFDNNAGGGVCCSFIKATDGGIIITDCKDDGGLRLNECLIADANRGIMITNYQCPQGKLRFKRSVRNVLLEDCSFKSALNETSNKDILSDVTLRRVNLCSSEERTWNYYCLSLVCAKMANVKFEECRFEVLKGSNLAAVLPSGGDWSGAIMDGCTIIEHRDISFYVPCDIINSTLYSNKVISFINHKQKGALEFNNNSVYIYEPMERGPFTFMSTHNQFYQLKDNIIYCSGVFYENDLIVRHKKNTGTPSVQLQGNIFRSM